MDPNNKYNISSISKLSTFINKYPDESLHEKLKLLQQEFPLHRAVKGDGNCFYRAFAFLYLAINPSYDYFQLFPKTTWMYLKPHSHIQSDLQFQQQLLVMWERYIQRLSDAKSRTEKEKKLQSLFNDAPHFDELMIGYFRSKNYAHISQNKTRFASFTQSEDFERNQLKRVRTFGAESEGIEIYALSQALQTSITIFQIGSNAFNPVNYNENFHNQRFYLLHRPGHYDIVYPYEANKELKATPEESGIITNIKSQITNKFQRLSNLNKKQEKIQQQQQRPKKSQKQITSQSNIQTNRSSKIIESGLRTAEKKRTYFSNQLSTNDGKFDVKFETFDKKNTTNVQQTPIKVSSTHKVKRNPTIVSSWNDPSHKLMTEMLGVGALAIFSYAIYSFW